MQRMSIPCEDGTQYLTRLRIIQTPWFGVYLHDLFGPDKDDPHDHPWDFTSFIVRGAYYEQVWQRPQDGVGEEVDDKSYLRRWPALSWHRMKKEWAHKIYYVTPGTKSLIFVGKRSRNWGFYVDGGWVPWNEYEEYISRKVES